MQYHYSTELQNKDYNTSIELKKSSVSEPTSLYVSSSVSQSITTLYTNHS